MKCHDIQQLIPGFIEGRLNDEQLESFLNHIAECKNCYDELEVHYMITVGLMQLDEEHTGTLDLKKNLKERIQEEQHQLYVRKRAAVNKKRLKSLGICIGLICLIFIGGIFLTSETGIHSVEQFQTEAMTVLKKFWFTGIEVPETETESVTDEREICRFKFETQHPLIPPYFYNNNTFLEIDDSCIK